MDAVQLCGAGDAQDRAALTISDFRKDDRGYGAVSAGAVAMPAGGPGEAAPCGFGRHQGESH